MGEFLCSYICICKDISVFFLYFIARTFCNDDGSCASKYGEVGVFKLKIALLASGFSQRRIASWMESSESTDVS